MRTAGVEAPRMRNGEDSSSIKALEVPLAWHPKVGPNPVSLGRASCLHFCTFTQQLVVGHADGKVRLLCRFCRFSPLFFLSLAPPRAALPTSCVAPFVALP